MERIKDLLNGDNSFLSYHQFCRKTGLKPPFTNFLGLTAAIPSKWKHTLRAGINLNSYQTKTPDQPKLNQCSCKNIQKLQIQKKFHEPLASTRLCRLGIDYSLLNAIYSLLFNLTKETKLSMFRYKIIHNILPYGARLYMMNLVNFPLCSYCKLLETLPHMLVEYKAVNDFWVVAISWWNHESGNYYTVDEHIFY